jgi:hypothetical protein
MSSFTLPADSDLSGIGVYNVLDQCYCGGMIPNSDAPGVATQNACALQAAIDAATANGGGTILIPTGEYYVAGTIFIGENSSPPVPVSLTIVGTSGNTTLIQTVSGTFFDVNTHVPGARGNDDIGGLTFQDLLITYAASATSGTAVVLADILASGALNVRLFRVVFSDCPQAVCFINTLQCSMLECSVTYVNKTPSPSAVQIGASDQMANETYISDCLFSNSNESPPGTGGIGLELVWADEVRIDDVSIEGFQQGIVVDPSAGQVTHVFLGGVRVIVRSDVDNVGAGLLIAPQGALVAHLVCVGCSFEPDPTYGTSYSSGGIFITGSGSGFIVDQLRFVSCYSCRWPGPGMQIDAGSNVEILGGYYSCNATLPESPPSPTQAGISISSGAANVRIIGAACNNSIQGEPSSQEYGISVNTPGEEESPNVWIRGCDLTGNLSGAAYIFNSPAVEITNCAGYNDQAKVLATMVTGATPLTIRNTAFGYSGPIAFYVSAGTSVSIEIDGALTGLTAGGFTLACGETAVLAWGIAPPSFLLVGK